MTNIQSSAEIVDGEVVITKQETTTIEKLQEQKAAIQGQLNAATYQYELTKRRKEAQIAELDGLINQVAPVEPTPAEIIQP